MGCVPWSELVAPGPVVVTLLPEVPPLVVGAVCVLPGAPAEPMSVMLPAPVGAMMVPRDPCAVTVIVEILPPVSEVVVAMEVVAIVVGWPAVYRLIRNLSAA